MRSHKKTILQALGRKPIHPFPARMAPGIALDALGETEDCLRVLDPMAGSGTVLAVARAKGHRAIGVDADPLAVLLSRVWTRTVDAGHASQRAEEVLHRAKNRFRQLSWGDAYPRDADDETRRFTRYWFDPYARRQLTALAASIEGVRDEATRDVLWCGFSRLIITKQSGASRAMDLSHSRPHRRFVRAPVKPFRKFLESVGVVVDNCPQLELGPVGPRTMVTRGDARQLHIPTKSIDLVVTSPPYLNAIDYLRCSKFSLVWMGYRLSDLRAVRSGMVGSEAASDDATAANWVAAVIKGLRLHPALSPRQEALLSQYVWDMSRALAETARVLRPEGRAVYVVGDSTIKGTFVRNSSVVQAVAEARGLELRARRSRTLPANRRYLPPPARGRSGAAINGRMRREVVLTFEKP